MALPIRLIPGGLHRDSRGDLQHVNSFGFERVDRFYTIGPIGNREVRGWVGHKRDWKWFFAVKGEFDLGVVQPMDWDNPAPGDVVQIVRLSAGRPALLEVPPDSYTASRALSPGAVLLIFSSGRIEDSLSDDFRLPSGFWPMA